MIGRLSVIIFCLIFFFPCNTAISSTYQTKKHELQRISHEINTITKAIRHDKKRRVDVEHELKKSDLKIASLTKQINRLSKSSRSQKKVVAKRQKRQRELEQQLADERALLAEQLRLAYSLLDHNYIKMLFSSKNPAKDARYFYYLDLLNKERTELIHKTEKTLQAARENAGVLQVQKTKLGRIIYKKSREQTALNRSKKAHEKILRQIEKSLNSKQARLARLERNKKALLNVLQRLKHEATIDTQFSRLKGKLMSPLKGGHVRSIKQYDGILMPAKEGKGVYAIADGKVVFADWLRGFGLLLIIDHGSGYMSLYGRNQDLEFKIGDKVKKGNLIAHVGKTGGYSRAGLYFALRHKTAALAPKHWCLI